MNLVTVETASLSGHALDWAVAKAEGLEVFLAPPHYGVPWRVLWKKRGEALSWDVLYNPHEDWALAGPLMVKHCAQFEEEPARWLCKTSNELSSAIRGWALGADHLEALCRAVVSAEIGETVQIPEVLING